MFDWIEKLITSKEKPDPDDPWIVYRTNRLNTQEAVNVDHFPFKNLLTDKGLYVYRAIFLVSEEDISRIQIVISEEFPFEIDETYFTAELANHYGLYIHVGVRREFNGAVVEMLTNNANLLNALDKLELQTLPPWVTFPDFDPEGFYCLQGNIEFWWFTYFLPFWEKLDKNRRFLYIENAPQNWKELFLDRYLDNPNR